jgi:hypothetical protein
MRILTSRVVRDERGIAGTVVVVSVVFIVALAALVLDGGILFIQRRHVVNAADAGALAAAQTYAYNTAQCGSNDGPAQAQADALATANYPDATRIVYQTNCGAQTVKVGYQATVGGLFSGSHAVATKSTAAWGASGGAQNVIPLMLSSGRLSNCNIPFGVTVGSHCYFWWDNGTGNNTTALTNSEWGLMDLRSWGPPYLAPSSSCSGYQANQSIVSQWIQYGFSGNLVLSSPGPTYVCRGTGFQGGALNSDINNFAAGHIVAMPVNDPSKQVDSSGALCAPGATVNCTVDKYAIIGFASLQVVQVYTGQQALNTCPPPPFTPSGNGNLRCLDTMWEGFQEGGILPTPGGTNFGLIAITLSG